MNLKKLLLIAGGLAVSACAWATVETVTYISDLNASFPTAGDALSEGDDHLRNLKTGIKNTFPNVTGAVNPTQTELNYSVGVTSAIQTQINTKAATADLGLHFIASTTLLGTATTVDFTASIDSTYDEYELHIINAVPVSTSTPQLQTSPDAGSSWNSGASDYGFQYVITTLTNVTASGSAATTAMSMCDSVTLSTTGISAVVHISDPAQATKQKMLQWTGSYVGGSSNIYTTQGSGIRLGTAAINGIRFKFSSGNIASGKFKLYGVRKS